MYLNDPRENSIDLDKHAIWESDNRVEKRYKWNSLVTDLCDMSVEEYMKNPIVEAIKSAGSGSSQSIEELNDTVKDLRDKVLNNMEENTEEIVSAITEGAESIVNVISGGVYEQVSFFYVAINNQTQYSDITKEMFFSGVININSDGFINYMLGDPSEEDWNLYTSGTISENELVERSNNDYYFVVPKKYGVSKNFILLEEGTSDVTSSFVEVSELDNLFEGYIVFKSHDKDHFNIDFPSETNVKIIHKIKFFN